MSRRRKTPRRNLARAPLALVPVPPIDLGHEIGAMTRKVAEAAATGHTSGARLRVLYRQIVNAVPAMNQIEDEAGDITMAVVVMAPLELLLSAKEGLPTGEPEYSRACHWIDVNLGGADYAGPAAVVAASLMGLPKAPRTVSDTVEALGEDFPLACLCLLSEGFPYERRQGDEEDTPSWHRTRQTREGCGVCSCGASSPVLETDGARKRWHRQHKDQLRAAS